MRIPYQINLLGLAVVIGSATLAVSRLDRKIKPNFATDAEIALSSRSNESPDPAKLVDGDIFQLGFHTHPEEHPWVQLDLRRERSVQHISVFNRLDCCGDRALPLEIQFSQDGVAFETIASADSSFTVWKLDIPKRRVRYVRLQVQSNNAFHLNEIEIR